MQLYIFVIRAKHSNGKDGVFYGWVCAGFESALILNMS